ncbi:MAG: hypothetical protein AAGG81_07435 [Chlamydiota bacterium]
MTGINFQTLNTEEFKKKCRSLSTKELGAQAKKLTDEQLTLLTQILAIGEDPQHENKLITTVSAMDNRSSLEVLGKAINAKQFFSLLKAKKSFDNSTFHKIPPLLVGMEFNVFTDVILEIPQQLLSVLQEEGCTEPLQHQLTLFCHELVQELDLFSKNLIQLEKHIDSFDTRNINHQNMLSTHQEIKKWAEFANANLKRINNALAIAWNTSRPDIIDRLSFQKESWLKYNTLVVGFPREYDKPASGLYARFESRLDTIFSNPDDPNDIEALQDEEPALEALVKFSLWYLHDYWEIGLLPNIKDISELDLDPVDHSDRERADYRSKLFNQAQANLEELGLKSVKDLKSKKIYSKEMLQEFLDTHTH